MKKNLIVFAATFIAAFGMFCIFHSSSPEFHTNLFTGEEVKLIMPMWVKAILAAFAAGISTGLNNLSRKGKVA